MRKLTAFFFLAILIFLLTWVVLHRQSNNVQPSITGTPYSYTKYTVHIPQKALLKNYVTVSVETIPEAKCELTYIPTSGEVYKMNATADASGLCEWRWKIEESDRAGDARLIFTINGLSDTHFMQIFAGF